jgi:hypothetical protein
LRVFKSLNALRHGEVLLRPILPHDKEATRLVVLRVYTDFEMVKVLKLLIFLFVQLQQFLEEVRVIARDFFTILADVQDSS